MKRKVLLIALSSSLLLGAPAFQKSRIYKNADGTEFVAKARGDEYLHWIESADGTILKYNHTTKNFEIAKIEGNKLVASGKVYNTKQELNATQEITSEALEALHTYNKTLQHASTR